MAQSLRLGGSAYLRYAHTAHGYPFTIFAQVQLNTVGGMLIGVEKAASEGTASIFMGAGGTDLISYTQTSAGGVTDTVAGGQTAYYNNAALIPIMLVCTSATSHTLFTPALSSGRAWNPQGAGATAADLNNFTDFVIGAWLRNGAAATTFCNTDVAEVAKWLYSLDSTHFASLAANAKPETVGNSTVQAALVDCWPLNPTGSVGAAAPTSFTGVVNGLTLNVVGTGATIASRTDPVSRTVAGPNITAQPSNQTVTAPATATFSVTATASGGGTLSYQWQRSTNSGGSWANVTTGTGGTTNSYTTAATSVTGGNANNADQWRCVVTETGGSNAGSVNSSAATLTVNTGSGPTINTQPSNQTVTAPATASFSVAATTSGGTLTYQWQRSTNSGSSWANVTTGTGGTTNSYTTAATSVSGGNANSGDQWRCVVSDSNGSVNSNSATLTVNPAPGTIAGDVIKDDAGNVQNTVTIPKVIFLRLSDNTVVLSLTNQPTNSSGMLSVTNSALVAGTVYLRILSNSSGSLVGVKAYTAT